MKERCDRCGKTKALQDYTPNQMATLRLCASCVQADRDKRSKAATGKAGRPAKTPSQLEDKLWKMALNSVDDRTLELWFLAEGFKGTRHQMLKSWALATIAAARKR